MGLVTPVIQCEDSVFPGENWFFYWKTSASLWESKLKERFIGETIVLPINWGMHIENLEIVDFGEMRPESDLSKLIQIIGGLGKKVHLYLPIGPAPYLPNGGIPTELARIYALNRQKMIPTVIDFENKLHKFYGPFDPRVYKAFGKFVFKLGQYLKQEEIYAPLWGVNGGYFFEGEFFSYFEDYSKALDPGFEEYLATLHHENIGPLEEAQFKKKFQNIIFKTYEDISKRYLSLNWEGVIKVAYLGGAPNDFFNRLCLQDRVSNYLKIVLKMGRQGVLPSSCLLGEKIKKGILARQLRDLNLPYLVEALRNDNEDDGGNRQRFNLLESFSLIEPLDDLDRPYYWKQLGLTFFLEKKFPAEFTMKNLKETSWHGDTSPHKIQFFYGNKITDEEFFFILNIFMNGGKVLFDINQLDVKLKKRLKVFTLENNFISEKIEYIIYMESLSLAHEGQLITYNGADLLIKKEREKIKFWDKVISTFNLYHLPLKGVNGVEFFWRSRVAQYDELSFEEIRRLSLYNPSSYRKKIKISLNKNFNLIKTIDEVHVKSNYAKNELCLELLPNGSVSLDFGIFS